MPIDYIYVDPNWELGARLRLAVKQLQEAHDALTDLKAIADHLTDGQDYGNIGMRFGVGADNAQVTYNLLAGTVAKLNEFDVVNLEQRFG